MTLSSEIALIASEIALCAPQQSSRLQFIAARVRRVEAALDEIVDDAREAAEIAERVAREGLTVRKIVPGEPASDTVDVM